MEKTSDTGPTLVIRIELIAEAARIDNAPYSHSIRTGRARAGYYRPDPVAAMADSGLREAWELLQVLPQLVWGALFAAAAVVGSILEGINSWIEAKWDERKQRRGRDIKGDWYEYLSRICPMEPIGHAYLPDGYDDVLRTGDMLGAINLRRWLCSAQGFQLQQDNADCFNLTACRGMDVLLGQVIS